jgi:hypothetical protein
MAGCMQALCFWRRKRTVDADSFKSGKSRATRTETLSPDPEKPPLDVRHAVHAAPAPRGVPVRPTVNPVYSAYSTPADTTWADFPSTKPPPSFHDAATLKDEDVDDAEEAARRKKAEQEEQERLDFFQMM